ncbi:MAG: cytochrome c biogenesis protein CcsA [Chloroflexia bacterium]
MTVGPLFLVGAFLSALGGMGASWQVIRGDRRALRWARLLAVLALVLVGVASALLLGLILAQRYDVAYVYLNTSRDLAFFYRLSAFWAGQEGSLLLWLLLTAVLTVLQIRRARLLEPYVLFFLLLIQAGLTVFLLVDSPFTPTAEVVPPGQAILDGQGLKPILQNVWMVAHPPMLFLGYAGMAVPLAYALAGLWRRDYEGWVWPALSWGLLGWLFLGLGILLGAFWAYETLGWGGYWGWDPVENSSLLPWLTGTALLHGLLIQRYRRRLGHGNLILAWLTYLLVLLATFLTRSGVLGAASVHSFAPSALTPWMLGLMALVAAAGAILLASRWNDLPPGPVFAGPRKGRGRPIQGETAGTVGPNLASWFSRDFTFLLTILLLLLVALPILAGTLLPVFSQWFGRLTQVDVSFYPQTTGPVLAVLLLVLGLCPLLGWSGSAIGRLGRMLIVPVVLAVGALGAAALLGAGRLDSLFLIFLAVLALASNVAMVVRTVRRGFLPLGGYLAHIGLGLLVVGVVASSVYNVDYRDAQGRSSLLLPANRAQEALGYRLTFVQRQESGVPSQEQQTHPARPVYYILVERGSERFLARLEELEWNAQDGSLGTWPYVGRYLTHDLYIAAHAYFPGSGEEAVLEPGQEAVLAGRTFVLREVRAAPPYVQVALTVREAGISRTITPTYAMAGTSAHGRPASLPDGTVVSVEEAGFSLDLFEGQPLAMGTYTVTLRDLVVLQHNLVTQTVAGAVIEWAAPAGITVITPTWVVSSEGAEGPPLTLPSGETVRLDGMDVTGGFVRLLLSRPGLVWLTVQRPEDLLGTLVVQVSIKPGINLLWAGGVLLLLGTAVALVRRWREGRQLLT